MYNNGFVSGEHCYFAKPQLKNLQDVSKGRSLGNASGMAMAKMVKQNVFKAKQSSQRLSKIGCQACS